MKIKRDVGVYADAQIVIHHVDLRVVFIGVRLIGVHIYGQLFLHVVHFFVFVRMKHNSPAVLKNTKIQRLEY